MTTTNSVSGAPADGATSIDQLRRRIDAIDLALVQALRQRVEASHAIQHVRASEGGPRVDQLREQQILGRFAAAFGAEGAELAAALLVVCRGRTLQ